jgi:hypothetical protein
MIREVGTDPGEVDLDRDAQSAEIVRRSMPERIRIVGLPYVPAERITRSAATVLPSASRTPVARTLETVTLETSDSDRMVRFGGSTPR